MSPAPRGRARWRDAYTPTSSTAAGSNCARRYRPRNVLYHYGPERLVIGKYCALGTGTRFIMNGANHRMDGPSNVVEGWNGANDVIFFGKSGELSSNRRDQQELSVLALHLLQTALVVVNTLMIQDMLADPEWADVLTDEDKRALTPLFWMHVQPYGEVRLNMGSRLRLAVPTPADPEPEPEPAAAWVPAHATRPPHHVPARGPIFNPKATGGLLVTWFAAR